jgi:hypothetical protein
VVSVAFLIPVERSLALGAPRFNPLAWLDTRLEWTGIDNMAAMGTVYQEGALTLAGSG